MTIRQSRIEWRTAETSLAQNAPDADDTNSFPNRIYPCFNFARCPALTGPIHEKDFALSDKSLHWPVDFVVLPDLVSCGSRPLLRFQSSHLDDVTWIKFDHRNSALHQLDHQRKQTSALANYPAFHDAVFCFELCGVGEREKFRPYFFAGPEGNFRRADFVRNVLRIRVGIESFKRLISSSRCHARQKVSLNYSSAMKVFEHVFQKRFLKAVIIGAILLFLTSSVYCWVKIVSMTRTRQVSRDLYSVVDQVARKPPTIERATEFIQKLRAINTDYAPAEVKRALKDYINAAEQSLQAWKAGQNTKIYDQKIQEQNQILQASLKKYSHTDKPPAK